jgi:AraC-like DNA-binding protein
MGAFVPATSTRKSRPNHGSAIGETAGTVTANSAARDHDAEQTTPIVGAQDERLRKILELIESHPSRKIHELASACNLSESRLQHLCKQRTGFGLGQLLTEQRMQQATVLLAHSNLSIKEIAGTIGYEHTSSFTRAFERRFRQTPSCYRHAQAPYKVPALNS